MQLDLPAEWHSSRVCGIVPLHGYLDRHRRRWWRHLEVPGGPPGLHPLELVVELGDVGEDGEAVGRVARGHVLRVQQRRDAQLLLRHPERQGTRPESKKRDIF